MHPKRFALVIGIIFLALGLLSFIPSLSFVPAEGLPSLRLDTSYALFLNTFPMNILNKVALIVFGVAGIFAYSRRGTDLPASIHYSRWVFAIMGALSILGMFSQTNTLMGYWPLYGNEVWMHGVFSLLGGYFGYALSSRVPDVDAKTKRNVPAHGLS